ncbi:MAG: Ig-like domain-containing protein [Lachnospira sp.]|nr:Ig-like domain-containing protein [Lachnospira sp.]
MMKKCIRVWKKGIAWLLILVMTVALARGMVFPSVKAVDLTERTDMIKYNGSAAIPDNLCIYEGETAQLTVDVGSPAENRWSCSDQSQSQCFWYTSNSTMNTGNSFTLIAHTANSANSQISITVENENLGVTQTITVQIIKNDFFYFLKGNNDDRVATGSLDPETRRYYSRLELSLLSGVEIHTNQLTSLSYTNTTGHVTPTFLGEGRYSFVNNEGQSTTDPKSPVMISSTMEYDEAPDGRIHKIEIFLNLHVIDSLVLSNHEKTVSKGREGKDSVTEIRASVTNLYHAVTWEVYKGRLGVGGRTPSALLTEEQGVKIATSSTDDYYPDLANIANISLSKDLDISETRVFTVFASQQIGERLIEDICYITVTQPATGLTLSNHEMTIFLDGSATSGATVTADVVGDVQQGIDADDRDNIAWVCTDETVATIEYNQNFCTIIPQKPGHCVIVASSMSNPDASDTVYVEVAPRVSSVTITSTDMTINLAEREVQLFANVQSDAVDAQIDNPDLYEAYLNALNTTVHWSSSNESVATVDLYTGKVKLLSAGQTTITCASAADAKIASSIRITVNVPVAAISLQDNFKRISVGESFTLNYTLLSNYPGYEPSNKEVSWESSDNKVAMVDNDGKVTGIAGGTATILIRADDGQVTATCTVEVYQAVSRIDISSTLMDLNIGEEAVLEAQIVPATASEQKVTWSSNKPEIVSVTQDGVIKAESLGEPVVITAYIVDRSATIRSTCIVNVVVPITSLTLSPASKTLAKGENLFLTKSITPADATNSSVVYASTDTSVATVDANGKVTAIAGGHCYITARSINRDMVSSCYITVDEKISKIKLDKSKKMMKKGSKFALSATITTATATNKELSWSSSNKKIVTVSKKGVITAKGYGTATVTCSSMDGSGKRASCKVTVRRYVTSLKLNRTKLTLQLKKSAALTAKLTPANADVKKLKWSSSDKKIATVKNGVVTAKKLGTCYINCKAMDGSGKKARCRVTVKRVVTDDDITGSKKK